MVDTPPEQMNEEEIQQHLADEDMEKKRRVAEEEQHQDAMARWQAEEDEMLRRQAALYQAWEDWEMNQHMVGGPPERPRLRKRCVLELEVASSSSDGPRRTQVIAVPEDGHVTIRMRAAMVEEVEESEVSTVVLEPPQHQPVVATSFEELGFEDFQVQYRRWVAGSLGASEVVTRFGPDMLEMMQAQWAACQAEDEEQDALMQGQRVEQPEPDGRIDPSLCGRHGEDLQQRVGTATGEEHENEEVVEEVKGHSSGLTQIEGSGSAVGEMGTSESSQPATVPESQYVEPVMDAADVGE